MRLKHFQEAVNTLNASWLEIKLAKLFGGKSIHVEENTAVTIYKWRGKYYLTEFEDTKP